MNSLFQRTLCANERFVPTNYVSRRIMCSLGERVRRDEHLVSLIILRCGGGDILSIGSRLSTLFFSSSTLLISSFKLINPSYLIFQLINPSYLISSYFSAHQPFLSFFSQLINPSYFISSYFSAHQPFLSYIFFSS